METKRKALSKPSEVYSECPACRSQDLLRMEVDVLCSDCDWMSCEQYVEMGGMDNFFLAFREHFSAKDGEEVEKFITESLEKKEGTGFKDRHDEPYDVEIGA